MNFTPTLWMLALGLLLLVLPGFNLIAIGLLAFGSGNSVGRLLGPEKRYKELR